MERGKPTCNPPFEPTTVSRFSSFLSRPWICSFFISMTKCRLSSSCSQKGLGLPCSCGAQGMWQLQWGGHSGHLPRFTPPRMTPVGQCSQLGPCKVQDGFVPTRHHISPIACVQGTLTTHAPPMDGALLPPSAVLCPPPAPAPLQSPSEKHCWLWASTPEQVPSLTPLCRGHHSHISLYLDVLLVVCAQERLLHPLHPFLERLQLGIQHLDLLLGQPGKKQDGRCLGFLPEQGHCWATVPR